MTHKEDPADTTCQKEISFRLSQKHRKREFIGTAFLIKDLDSHFILFFEWFQHWIICAQVNKWRKNLSASA